MPEGTEQLLPVAFDKKTGLNSYKIIGPDGQEKSLNLFGVENYAKNAIGPAGGFNQSQQSWIDDRLKKLYFIYGEKGIDPGFALDLAGSSMDFHEAARLMKYRMKLSEKDPSWYTRIWNNPATRGTAHVVGGGFNWFYDHTMNSMARAVNHDKEATFQGMAVRAWLRIGGHLVGGVGDQGKDIDMVTAMNDPETGQPISEKEWIANQDAWGKGVAFTAGLIDPTIFLGALKAARIAAGTIKGAEAVSEASSVGRAFATTLDDASRIMQGSVKPADWFRGVSMTDVVRASLGKSTTAQTMISKLDNANSAWEIRHLLGSKAPDSLIGYLLNHNAAAGGQGVHKALVGLFDPLRVPGLKAELEESAGRISGISKEIDAMPTWARQSLHELSRTPIDQRLIRGGQLAEPLDDSKQALWDHAMDLTDEVSSLKSHMHSLNEDMNAQAFISRVPKQALTSKMGDWAAKHFMEPLSDASDGFGIVREAMSAVGKPIGRTLRGVGSMLPHPVIDVATDTAGEQFHRWINEVELITQKSRPIGALKEKLGGGERAIKSAWTRADSEQYYNDFISAKDDIGKIQVMRDAQGHFLSKSIGFDEGKIKAIMKVRDKAWDNRLTFVGDLGEKVRFPLSPADQHHMVPILAPHEMRRLARMGTRTFKDAGDFEGAVGHLFEKANHLWKSMAIFRPAWVTRVVLLSEQPRLAMAGLPNMMTHPLLALATSPIKGVNSVAQKLLGARLKLPIFRTERTLVVEGLDGLWKELRENGGVWRKTAKAKTEAGVGALKADIVPGWDPAVPSSFKWSDLEHEVDQKFYREGWANGLNNHIAGDPMAQQWVNGKTEAEVSAWVKSDERGIELQHQLGIQDDDVAQWVHANKARYDQWTKGLSPQQIAKMGNLKPGDLVDDAGELMLPPHELPSDLWTDTLRRPGMHMPKAKSERLLRGVWNKMSADPSYYLSRSGPVQYEFVSEVQRLSSIARGEITKKGVPTGRVGELVQLDEKKIFQSFVGKKTDLTPVERGIAEQAYKLATDKVKGAVYDLAESARVADLARFVFPFANAFQEEMTRWAMLGWARPHIPIALANMWRNKDLLPVSYKDPRTGEEMYYLPFSSHITKFVTGSGWNPITKSEDGVAWPLTGRWNNLNILTGNGMLPGGGPWVQIGANQINKIVHLPTGLMNTIDPYAGRNSWSDKLMPSPFYRAYREISADQKTRQNAVTVNAVIQQAWFEAGGDPNKIDIDKAEKQAKALTIISNIANLSIGSGVRSNLPPKIAAMGEYLHWVQTNFPAAGERLFLEKYGEQAAAFMTHFTKNLTGEPPTKEAEDLLLNPEMRDAARKYGNVFWALMSESARGEYDPVAYASQVARGDREYREGDSFLKAAVTFTGWWRYGHLKNQFQAVVASNGWTESDPEYAAAKKVMDQERQKLFDAYPKFHEEWLGASQHTWQINQLRLWEAIKEPYADQLQGTKGAKEYFDYMRQLKDAMNSIGLKSLSSKKAAPLAEVWHTIVTDVLTRYPDFQLVYDRLNLDNIRFTDSDMPWGPTLPKETK